MSLILGELVVDRQKTRFPMQYRDKTELQRHDHPVCIVPLNATCYQIHRPTSSWLSREIKTHYKEKDEGFMKMSSLVVRRLHWRRPFISQFKVCRLERQQGKCNSQQHRNYRIHPLAGTNDFRAFAYRWPTTD
jgi:hypothetical protein